MEVNFLPGISCKFKENHFREKNVLSLHATLEQIRHTKKINIGQIIFIDGFKVFAKLATS